MLLYANPNSMYRSNNAMTFICSLFTGWVCHMIITWQYVTLHHQCSATDTHCCLDASDNIARWNGCINCNFVRKRNVKKKKKKDTKSQILSLLPCTYFVPWHCPQNVEGHIISLFAQGQGPVFATLEAAEDVQGAGLFWRVLCGTSYNS